MKQKKDEKMKTNGTQMRQLVQKSRPLCDLWQSDLTLSEFKILDTYLSRINSHEPEKKAVVFEKGELETLLGVKRIKTEILKERLRHLMGHVVELTDPEADNGFMLVSLFEEAVAEQDENGLWQVKMECTDKAMKYFFNVESLGYLRYKLQAITSLTSRYSYVLYVYLELNRFRKSWKIDLDELRRILNCDKEESYAEYKVFSNRILQRCQKELREKSDCIFTYEPIKKGRKVVAVKFSMEATRVLPAESVPPEAEPLPWYEEDLNDPLGMLSAACDHEFSKEQMQVIFAIISGKKLENEYGIDIARFHYLQEKYMVLNLRATNTKIPHRFNYFKTMLENDR